MTAPVTALLDDRKIDLIAAALLTAGPAGGYATANAATAARSLGPKAHESDITEHVREGAFYRWTRAGVSGCVLAAALVVMAFAITDSVRAVQGVARSADSELIAVERYLQRNYSGLELLF